MVERSVAHYRIEKRLGAGGMGMVYRALDTRLERPVALKEIHAGLDDAAVRERFRREARAAAALNHPAICQVHDLLEDDGRLYIVMEYLEGETLEDRLAARGPLALAEASALAVVLLDALGALHDRRLVHRDLKPSNVFLLRDGRVKLLDFGLVHQLAGGEGPAGPALTLTTIGSPGYMAPEQVRGEPLDGRTDLFALGVILHEAVSGRRAFTGRSAAELMYAVLHHEVDPLAGEAEDSPLAGALARALRKSPAERWPDARAMTAAVRGEAGGGIAARRPAGRRRPMTRIAVLPFRMLRPDPDLDFLAPSLADAIAMSLAGIESLVVCATAASARFAGAAPDLNEMHAALRVEVVLVGTLLVVGNRCRVATQLVEAPSGHVLWSLTEDVERGDVFHLQDSLTRRIVESLQLPLSGRELSGLRGAVPSNATAYELFLRANRAAATINEDLPHALELYRRTIASDPDFALGWARLGRCLRVMAKYLPTPDRSANARRAEEAFQRALEIAPDLPAAHHLYAQLELDHGAFEPALERLLGVVERNPNDPEGYAGLVSAFRYAGLLEDSLVAGRHVRRLAPEMRTSIMYTFVSLGEYEHALDESRHGDYDLVPYVLLALGRRDEALRFLDAHIHTSRGSLEETWFECMRATARGDLETFRAARRAFEGFPDPEGHLFTALGFLRLGRPDEAEPIVAHSLTNGYVNLAVLDREPGWSELAARPRIAAAVATARERAAAARERFAGRLRPPSSGS